MMVRQRLQPQCTSSKGFGLDIAVPEPDSTVQIVAEGIGHSDRVSRASPSRDVMSRPRGWPVAGIAAENARLV